MAAVKLCRVGESVGYGRRFQAAADTHIGLLPIGYGDGWRRGLSVTPRSSSTDAATHL